MDFDVAEKLLFETTEVLESYGVPPFLQCGTALGAVREKDFIKWDKDVDLAVRQEEVQAFWPNIAADLTKRGFRVRTISAPFNQTRVVQVRAGSDHLDVIGMMKDGLNRFCTSTFQNYSLVLPDSMYQYTERVNFRGRVFHVPTPVEKYLVLNYGKDWRVPNPKDYKSRCRVWGYVPGQGMMTRNHSEEHLANIWKQDGYYSYLLSYEYIENVVRRAAKLIPQGSRVLDVGCGPGTLVPLLPDGCSYLGVEGSPTALKTARPLSSKTVRFHQGRFENFHWFSEGDFDVLFMGGILRTCIQPKYYVEFIRNYQRAFGVKRLVLTDDARLDPTALNRAFEMCHLERIDVEDKSKRRVIGAYKL